MMLGLGFAGRAVRHAVTGVLAAITILFSCVAVATAYGYDNRTVDQMGVVSWGQCGGFVVFVEGLPSGGGGVPRPCMNLAAYFDQTQTNSKFWYMTFLTAKASGLHVHVEITQDAYDNCFIVSARIKS